MTNLFSQSASGSLASTFGDFHTPSQGSAMKFLNAGSTAEGSSTKRSSLSPVKPVGSGFSSPSRVSAPLVQGPVFSTDTDTDPNTSETRFVCFDLIPEQWTQESAEGYVLNRALEYTGLIGLIDTAVGSPSEVPGFVNIFCRWGDVHFQTDKTRLCSRLFLPLSHSASSAIMSASVLTTKLCCTMSHLPTKMERQDSGIPADNRKTLQSAGSSACNAMLVAEVVKNGDSGYIESYTKRFRAVFLFGSVARNAIHDTEVGENGSSEYLDFRSTEFSALPLFEDVTSHVPTYRLLPLR
ncbi:hypothetical protein D6D28_02197 [Aureobasidium pullulans]|uniref:Uncharacterized protein n=1 Tax=Aureobasidium pullulans TaxID=5580 RepID=A0A4S8SUR6_AURPU|nr:hypothetical protein D6D28_02197 [Aureobasidium pullulans]